MRGYVFAYLLDNQLLLMFAGLRGPLFHSMDSFIARIHADQ
jgi:hypothetical protein